MVTKSFVTINLSLPHNFNVSEDEIRECTVTVKDLSSGDQETLPVEKALERVLES